MAKIKKFYSILLLTLLFSLFPSSLEGTHFFAPPHFAQASEKSSKNFLEQGNDDFTESREVIGRKKKKPRKAKKNTKKSKNYRKKRTTKVTKIESPEKVEVRSYVVNVRTKKFHLPSCHTIKRMSAKNRKDVKQVRDELINAGYSSCKVCYP